MVSCVINIFVHVILVVVQCSFPSTVILCLLLLSQLTWTTSFLYKSTREETSSLRKQLDSQTKELNQRMRQIEELREKERIANENVSEFLLARVVKLISSCVLCMYD